MRQGIIERRRTRREIRKVNRIARVDSRHSQRVLVTVALIIVLITFVVAECFGIVWAKRVHDRNLVRNLADEATIELSMVNTGLMTGDHALLKDSHQKYRVTLAELNANGYMKRDQLKLLDDLNKYDELLSVEEEKTQLTKLHTAIMIFQEELRNVDSKKISSKSMVELKEHFQDFRDSLDYLDGGQFDEIKAQLSNYSEELIAVVDKISVCVGTCTESTFKTRSGELKEISRKYGKKLAELDASLSDYYSPARLVESLKMLQ